MESVAHRFVARNPPHVRGEGEVNIVHTDDGARALGFRGALVPGCFAASHAINVAMRDRVDMLKDLRIHIFCKRPVYDGVAYCVTVDKGSVQICPETGGDPCIVARVLQSTAPPPRDAWPPERPRPPPASRLPATVDACPAGTVLGSIDFVVDPEARGHCGYTEVWRDGDRFTYAERCERLYGNCDGVALGGVVHPCYFLEVANGAVCSTIAVGPWIHVETEYEAFGAPVRLGERVSVRGVVRKAWTTRAGHHFVACDLFVVRLRGGGGEEDLAARMRHTAIIRVGRQTSRL